MADLRFIVSIHEARVYVFDEDFGYDAMMEVSGDFVTKEEKVNYAQAVANALNAVAGTIPTPVTKRDES